MLRFLSVFFFGCLAVQAGAQPVQFQDMAGNAVRLAGPAQRTVTTPMPAASVFATVNRGAQGLAGMHPSTHANLKTMLLPEIFPQMARVRHDITRGSGFMPNVESLLQIQPDLVWQWGHMGNDLITPLKAAGLNVAAIRYGKEVHTRQWMEMFAASLGQPERGTALNAWRQQIQTRLQQQLAQVPAAQRKRIMYLSRYKTGLATAGQSGNFQFDAEAAGGINVNTLQAGAPTINVEQLLIWDPEVIVLTNFEHDLTPRTLLDNPLLADISAVRNQRVYKVPAGGYYWDPPSQDSPLYWIWLAKLMYPDQVRIDLRSEIRSAYRLLYDFEISEAQINQLLHWDVNRSSSRYAATFAAPAVTARR